MSLKPGDSLIGDFVTQDPSTGGATNADVNPSAILVRGGSDTAVSVGITNKDDGIYRFSATVPSTYNAGDVLQVRASASVGGVLGRNVVWSGVLEASAVHSLTGTGASLYPIVVTDENNNPLDGVEVWVTTDQAGVNVVAGTLTTDANGGASPMLDAGDYYLFRQKSGYNFDNPLSFSVG